jgi:hypothetical protein
VPDYACQRVGIATGTPPCQAMRGANIDAAVAALVLEQLTPLALETALQVSAELAQRAEHADRIRAAHVQRAQHAADAARRRYLAVDLANRLVADTLEADYNHRLRELADAHDDYDRAQQAGSAPLTDEQQTPIRTLAADLPALFNDPATPLRERKRLIRLLITDVTPIKTSDHILAHVRMPGGTLHTLTVPRSLKAWEAHTTPPATIARIGELLADHTYDQTVAILNDEGLTSGWDKPFTVASLTQLCKNRGIPSHRDRLQATGMLTAQEIADQLAVTPATIKIWRRRGDITARRVDGRREHLYHPGQTRPPDRRRRSTQDPVQQATVDINPTTSPGGAV